MVSENEKLREALKNAFDGDDVATKNIALRKAYDALSTPCVEQDADEVGEHKRCPWCRSRPILESSMFANRSSYRSGCSNEACHVQPYAAGSSIAEAWERWDALSAIQNRKTRPESDDAGLREALDGFGDDYITSETHHPNWVLIPTKTFDRIRAARFIQEDEK